LDKRTIEFKLAGGAAAQTLGLINALYVKKRTGRDVKFRYFPHSTGTFWPFAIDFMLNEGELVDADARIKGFEPGEDLAVGKIIRDHPLEKKFFSYERLLKWIRALRLEFLLRRIKGEVALEALPQRLNVVTKKISSVSGGFVPIWDQAVMVDMNSRFLRSRKEKSPFRKDEAVTEEYVAIHYRIGDKRAKFTHDKDFGGDGIFDPACFLGILKQIDIKSTTKVYVVSDEPNVARDLLANCGIKTFLFRDVHDIWTDLYYLSQAKVLIGTWSQVSQLAAICVANNGGISFLPDSTQVGTQVRWKLPRTEFFQPTYLEADHPIYSADFDLESDAHKGYLKKSES
jgi:hypothetical protein